MEFHAAMETFAEAWIAANLQNYSTTDETQVSCTLLNTDKT